MKLHIGCGRFNLGDDWVHIDAEDYDFIKYKSVKVIPIKDNKVDLIYSSYLLHYFSPNDVRKVLMEWHRLMKDKAVLRISVPDAFRIMRMYNESKMNLDAASSSLLGTVGQVGFVKSMWDFTTMQKALNQCGFINIKRYDFWKTPHDCNDSASIHYKDELISLNIECYANKKNTV